MGKYKTQYECPECEQPHSVEFKYDSLDDGDELVEKVVCKCGCEFDAAVECQVDIDFMPYHPEITKSGKV